MTGNADCPPRTPLPCGQAAMRIAYVLDDRGRLGACEQPCHQQWVQHLRWVGHQVQLVLPYARGVVDVDASAEWRCRWPLHAIAALLLRKHWRGWAPDVVSVPMNGAWSATTMRVATAEGIPIERPLGHRSSCSMHGYELDGRLASTLAEFRRSRVTHCRDQFHRQLP